MSYTNIIFDRKSYYHKKDAHESTVKTLLSRIEDFNNSMHECYNEKLDKYNLDLIISNASDLSFQFSIYNVELINFIIFSENLSLKNQLIKVCHELNLTLDFCDNLIEKEPGYPIYV